MDAEIQISRRAWFRQARRTLIRLVITLVIVSTPVLSAVTSSERAEAAGSGPVTVCVLLPSNKFAANFNLTLYRWNGLYAETIRTGSSGWGCATFYQVPAGHYYYIWAQSPSGAWWGYTYWFIQPEGGKGIDVYVHR